MALITSATATAKRTSATELDLACVAVHALRFRLWAAPLETEGFYLEDGMHNGLGQILTLDQHNAQAKLNHDLQKYQFQDANVLCKCGAMLKYNEWALAVSTEFKPVLCVVCGFNGTKLCY
jgi:hypothetical protein